MNIILVLLPNAGCRGKSLVTLATSSPRQLSKGNALELEQFGLILKYKYIYITWMPVIISFPFLLEYYVKKVQNITEGQYMYNKVKMQKGKYIKINNVNFMKDISVKKVNNNQTSIFQKNKNKRHNAHRHQPQVSSTVQLRHWLIISNKRGWTVADPSGGS
jgi:hypothetical protein